MKQLKDLQLEPGGSEYRLDGKDVFCVRLVGRLDELSEMDSGGIVMTLNDSTGESGWGGGQMRVGCCRGLPAHRARRRSFPRAHTLAPAQLSRTPIPPACRLCASRVQPRH